MTRMLSLAALSVLELPPPEAVSCAAAAGFDALGLRLEPSRPGDPRHPMSGDTPMLRETLARLADTGLAVLDVEVVWLRPDTRAEAHEPLFETAARLGARRILAAGADPDLGRAAETFARVCAAAGAHGLGVDLEYMVFSTVRSLEEALAILAGAGRPANAGVLFDALHIARAGTPLAALKALDPGLVAYAQICDAPAQAPDDLLHEARMARLAPGEGDLKLRDFIAALPPDTPLSVEVPLAGPAGGRDAAARARLLHAATRRVVDGA